MARGVNLADLAALTSDSTLVADQEITAIEHNAHRRKTRLLMNHLLTGLLDKESGYAGSGQPISRKQGKLYLDTDDSLFKGYKTNAGTPVKVLESGLAYTLDLATAGTGTFRMGGPLNVNMTNSALALEGDFAQTYTLPAGTLARNGQYVHVVWSGTRSAAVATFSLAPYFGSAAGTAVASTINSLTNWIIEMWVWRTGAATQDFAWKCSFNSDATGSTTLVSAGTLTETLSGAVTIKLNLSALDPPFSPVITQLGMLTEIGG